jgi:PIN domain nuclease of toxin-antitoxin system
VKYLLDTHVLIYWLEGKARLSREQKRIVGRAGASSPLLISDITLWEIATLYELGRIRLRVPLRDWLEAAASPPLVERVGISPAIAADVAVLPPTFHRDPVDRILVATARVCAAVLLTNDTRIIESGIVRTVE